MRPGWSPEHILKTLSLSKQFVRIQCFPTSVMTKQVRLAPHPLHGVRLGAVWFFIPIGSQRWGPTRGSALTETQKSSKKRATGYLHSQSTESNCYRIFEHPSYNLVEIKHYNSRWSIVIKYHLAHTVLCFDSRDRVFFSKSAGSSSILTSWSLIYYSNPGYSYWSGKSWTCSLA